MKRKIDLNEISDGRLYSTNDMVRADCHDCEGCSDCCRGMGSSIILDPMDLWRMRTGIHKDFQSLMQGEIELGLVDGMVLPNIRMKSGTEECPFLNQEGRCSIHPHRPGFCRLFPLGRYYTAGGFKYFLQVRECRKKERGKIKIARWLGVPNIKAYEAFIWEWHRFLLDCENAQQTLDDEKQRILSLYVLRTFYETEYFASDENAFYEEFYKRLNNTREMFDF